MIGRTFTPNGNDYLKHVVARELQDAPFKVVDGGFTKLELYDLVGK